VWCDSTLDACKKAFAEDWLKFQQLARPGYKIGYGIAAGYKNVGAGKGKVDDSGARLHCCQTAECSCAHR